MRHLTLAVLAAAACITTATAQPQRGAGDGPALIDLTFPGGTALDYLNAVRERAPHVNVITQPDVALVQMEPVQLQRVDTASAVFLLSGMDARVGDRWIVLDVGDAGQGPGEPIYVVRAKEAGRRGRAGLQSAVWLARPIIERGVAAEDLLTAVETAVRMFAEASAQTEISFHAETALVIARGPTDEIEAIESVIDALLEMPGEDVEGDIERIRHEAMLEIEGLQHRLEGSHMEIQELTRHATEWQSKAEFYMARVEQAMQEAREAQQEVRHTQHECQQRVTDLEAHIHMLQRRIAELEQE
jgi:hypothetical protein